MSFSKSTTPLAILFLCALLQAANAANPLFHFCFSNQNYAAGSRFGANLNTSFHRLSQIVPSCGFGFTTIGENETEVNGLALCRGDVSSPNCETCVNDAATELRNRCPSSKGAIIWYDNCLLKYSDQDFFGKIDNQNKFTLTNGYPPEDPETFHKKFNDLMSGLSQNASSNSKFYATGEVELDKESEKLYGFAQCTRDLSRDNCKQCLDVAISEIPRERGARRVTGSCSIRYELYPIVGTA